MPSVDSLGTNDTQCDGEPNNSVPDSACAPNATVVGFMGGHGAYPSYSSMNYSQLNYSETVRLRYDPAVLSYGRVLDTFFKYAPGLDYPTADPAYRLRLFTTSAAQYATASAALERQRVRMNATRLFVELHNASAFQFWRAAEVQQQMEFKAGTACGLA